LEHTCGVTTDSLAYCWGAAGMIGSVTGGADRLSPTPVAGGLHFSALKAGITHTCGVTTTGRVWCWGLNGNGQLGDGNKPTGSAVPVEVRRQ
jgi:alpha-tubulin suppressor-like RCC1 family protein